MTAEGCGCTELCSMGPTCPGGILAGLSGSGCWRTTTHHAACDIPDCGDRRCDSCDERMTCLGPEPVAIACSVHADECADCNADNPCRQCADERRKGRLMGMFDSFYSTPGYEYEHEWQVKAYGRQLATWHVGDQVPDDYDVQTYQVEVIGGREIGGSSSSSWSFATVVDGVLTAVPAERDPALPLIGFSGGLLEAAS